MYQLPLPVANKDDINQTIEILGSLPRVKQNTEWCLKELDHISRSIIECRQSSGVFANTNI